MYPVRTTNKKLLPALTSYELDKMEPKVKKQHFSSLSKEDIQHLIEKKDSENTQKAIRNAAYNRLAVYMQTRL